MAECFIAPAGAKGKIYIKSTGETAKSSTLTVDISDVRGEILGIAIYANNNGYPVFVALYSEEYQNVYNVDVTAYSCTIYKRISGNTLTCTIKYHNWGNNQYIDTTFPAANNGYSIELFTV